MLDQSPDAAAHLRALIACRSVTPADGGAQTYLAGVLERAGFRMERLTFSAPGTPDVGNLFATIGSGTPPVTWAATCWPSTGPPHPWGPRAHILLQ